MKISDELHVKLKRGSKSAFEAFAGLIVEECLRSIPHVIESCCRQTMALHKLSAEFYQKHPEFVEHRDKVPKVLERIEAENPGISPTRLVELGASRMKDYLSHSHADFSPPSGERKTSPFGLDAKLRGL